MKSLIFSDNRTILLGLCVVIALAAALMLNIRAYRQASSRLAIEQQRYGERLDFLSSRDSIREYCARYSALVESDNGSGNMESTALLRAVEALAGKHGIPVDTMRPGASVAEQGIVQHSVEVEFTSSLDTLVRFMHAAQEDLAWLSVSKIQIAPHPDRNAVVKVNMLLTKQVVVQRN